MLARKIDPTKIEQVVVEVSQLDVVRAGKF